MTKLDEMKKYIVDQIMEMDTGKFLAFQDTLIDFRTELEPTLDLSFVFTCDQCRKLYGNCKKNNENCDAGECIKRFTDYGNGMSKSI